MSTIDNPERDGGGEEGLPTRNRVSRRTLITTAAGAGVAAATVGIVGVAAASSTHRPATSGAPGLTSADAAGATVTGPIMVHLVDQAKGTVEVFTPTTHTQVTDHDLATRIARAAGN